MKTRITVENGETLKAINGFLASLLKEGVVEMLLVPMRTPNGPITHGLVKDPALLDQADLLAPVLPINSASLAGKISIREPRPKVGVVMRSCELRALVELVKLQQASYEDLLLIAVDCAGAFPVTSFVENISCNDTASPNPGENVFVNAENGHDEYEVGLRSACRICEQPVFDRAGISIELFGSDRSKEIFLTVKDDLAEKLGLEGAETGNRDGIVGKLVTARTVRKETVFAGIRQRLEGNEGIIGIFASCLRCHNCMTVCPLCYCKTCVFKSQLYDHEPMQYAHWAGQKGAQRMHADMTLFHLTRLNHMVLSCVGCGMCTEACPSELPVGEVFRAIGERVQAKFDYLPGRDLEETPPLITFKADEWNEVGE
jgi:formate dehydrogenase subunit beta